MKIIELLEQTIGSIGSTTGEPTPVQPVSQKTPPAQPKVDPRTQQLAALLKQNKVINTDSDINTFLGAAQAQLQKKTLNPDQETMLGKLAGPMMNDPTLMNKIKMLVPQKPVDQGSINK